MAEVLTFLVVDQVGSTEQIQRLGDQGATGIREALLEMTGAAVASWGGSIYHYTGDGLMASFDLADHAIWAATQMQHAATEFTATQPEGEDIVLRVGIHSGLPVITPAGHFIGIDCHIAARLCSVATPASIVVSEQTRALSTSDAPLTSLGRLTLKGIPDPPELFGVDWPTRRPPTAPYVGATAPAPAPIATRSSELRVDHIELAPSPLIERATVRSGTFVGRTQEYEALRTAWSNTLEGRAQLVSISAEAGYGKSSLAASFAASLPTETAVVLAGRCDEFASISFEPFIHCLRHLVEQVPVTLLADHASIHGEILTVLVPEIGTRLGIEFIPADIDETSADRLFAAVVDILARVSRLRPMVLLVEDLHWANEPTVRLLRHISRAGELSHLMIVTTMRPADVHGDTAPMITDMLLDANAVRLELPPFSTADVTTLLMSMLDQIDPDTASQFAHRIVHDTGGVPFFVREMIRHLREVSPAGRLPDFDRDDLLPLPDGVIEVVQRRADHLGAPVRSMLQLAAEIGNEFDLRVLAAIADMSDDDLVDAIDAAEASQLVMVGRGSGAEIYRFSHDLFRVALAESFGSARQRRLHARIADAMVEHIGLSEATAPELLRHLVAAGRREALDTAVQAAELAARASTAAFAFSDSVRYQRTALDIATSWDGADQELLAIRQIALAQALDLAGQFADANDHFWVAAEHARSSARFDLFSAAALGYGGELPTNPPPDDRAIALLEELLGAEATDPEQRARGTARLAEWQHSTTAFEHRRRLCDDAVSIAEQLDRPRVLARVQISQARALHGPRSTAANLDLGHDINVVAEATASDDLRFNAASIIATSAFEVGDVQRATTETEIARELGHRLRHVAYTRSALMWDAMLANARGDWGAAERTLSDLSALLRTSQHVHSDLIQRAIVLPSFWLQGQAALIHDIMSPMAVHDFAAMAAGYAADAGRLDAARRHLADFGPIEQVAERANYSFWHLCFTLGLAASELDDRPTAAAMYDVISPFVDHFALMGTVAFLGAGHHHLGVMATTCGNLDEADELFALAIERHLAIGATPWVALSQIERARVLERLGGHDRTAEASALAAEATMCADELGLGSVHRRAGLLATASPR